MLRTPRARLPAIKYLDKKIPKNLKQARAFRDKEKIYISEYTIKIINHEVALVKDDEKKRANEARHEAMELHDFFYFFYPNKAQLVINALISGLQLTESNYVNRATLDFLISHMPLKEDINTIQEKIRLVERASLTYTKKDFATLNKLQNWLFEHFDEEEEEIDSQDPTIIAIVESQKNLFQQSMDPKNKEKMKNMKTGLAGQSNQQSEYRQLMNNPILILLRIMSDENGTTVPILKNLSSHLIKFIRYHLPTVAYASLPDKDEKRYIDNLKNLLEQISPQYQAVLDSLAIKLNQEIESLDYTNQQPQYMQLESIEIISYAIFDMLNLYKQLLHTPQSKFKLSEILSTLLSGMKKISNENENLELIQPSLNVVERILDTF
jgi:hypothetical protein